MNLKQNIAEIEKRVKASGLSMRSFLIDHVDISPSTWVRWKQHARGHGNGRSPNLDTWNRVARAASVLRPRKKGVDK